MLLAAPVLAAGAVVYRSTNDAAGVLAMPYFDFSGAGIGPWSHTFVQLDGYGNVVTGSGGGSSSNFAPGSTYATLSVSTTSGNVALPAGATVVVYNTGTGTAYVHLGASSAVTATTSQDVVPAGGAIGFVVGSNSYLAGITASGSTSLVLSGGAGLYTGVGGGGSGGGGGTVTQGSPAVVANSWPVYLSQSNAVVSSSNPIFTQLTAGSAQIGTVLLGGGSSTIGTVLLGAGSSSIGTVLLGAGSSTVGTVNLGTLNGAATAALQSNVQASTGTTNTTATTVQGAGTSAVPLVASVNQVNNTTALAGAGAAGGGSLRTTTAQDTTTIAGSAPGTAGSASSNVLSVQGIASMTPFLANPGTAANWALGTIGSSAPGTGLYNSGQARSSEPTAATNGNIVGLSADLAGKLLVSPYANKENMVTGTASVTGTTSTSLIAAPGSGLYVYVTEVSCYNSGATAVTVSLQNGSGGTAIYVMGAPAGSGFTANFPTPIGGEATMSANTALFFAAGGSTTTLYCNASGYKGT